MAIPSLHVLKSPISQQEIEILIGFRNQMHNLAKLHDKLCSEILSRMLAGSQVERGVHCAELKEDVKGSRRITQLVVYSLLLGLLPLAAQAAEDPAGWSKAKWGMTEQQILDALPGQAVRLGKPEKFDAGPAVVGIPSMEIASLPVRIFFICGDAGLHQVEIASGDTTARAFQVLEAALVDKYGKPWSRSTGEIDQSQWSLPSTTLTLRRVRLKNVAFESLWLTYAQRERSTRDEL